MDTTNNQTNDEDDFSINFSIMDSILQQLHTRFDDVAIDYYPDDPENYRLNHDNGALLLNYGRGKYGELEDINDAMSEKTVNFTLTIVSRKLHGQGELNRHTSATRLVERAGKALAGFKPKQAERKIRLLQDYFIRYNAGLFYYGLDFSTTTLQVPECFDS